MSDSEHSDASVTWEDFFGTSTDLVPTLLGMYDAALRETISGSQTSKQHKRRSITSLQQSAASSRPTSPSLLKQCLTTNVSKTEKRQSSTTLPGDTATSCNADNSNGASFVSKNCGSTLHGNIKKQLNIASRTQSTCSINSYVFTPNVKRILSNLEDDVTVSSPCLSPTSCESRDVDYCKSSKDTTCFMSCVKKCECSKSSENSCGKSHEHKRTNTCEDSDKCTNCLKKVDLLQSESTHIFTDEIQPEVKVSDQKSKKVSSQSGLNETLQNKSSSQNREDQNSKNKSPQNGRPLTFTDGLRNCFLYRYNSTLRNKLTSPILSRKVPKTNTVDNNSRVPIDTASREKTNNDSNVTASEDIPTAKDNKSTVSFQQSKVRNVPFIPKIELESKSSQSPESSANDDLDGGTTTNTGPGSSVLLQVPRPLSMSSIASSTSTSSASSGGVANKSGVNAYLASIESLDDDSDCDNDLRHVNRTLARVKECEKESGSQGSGDSGIMVSVPICVYPKPARYCDPQLSPVERVLMEIVDTEAIYVDDLHQVIQGYLDHWKQDEECLLLEHLPDLFSNIEEIYSFNSKFLDQLQQCGLNAVNISRTFVQNNDGFEIYTQYCTNYPKTMSVLTRLMSSDMTAKMFRDLQSRLGHSLPLGSYLLKPVQRILKYHLLLQNLMKQCGNEDVGDIELALLTMTGIAQHINNMKRKHEHEVRVQEIQSLLYGWDGEDLTTFGELCAEGTFRMHGAKAQRHAFLFDKMLLLTKNKEDGILSYKAHIMCSNLMLIESVPGEPLSFHVIPFDNPRMQCTLQARNLEQKREWTLQLKRVILENYNAVIPNHARQLVMQLGQNRTDDEVLAEKSNSGKKQHSAPEYLQRRKIDRERRKSETGLRYKLRKSRKSDVSPSLDTNDADDLHDGEETSSPVSVTRRSLTRNCSENRERSKSRDTFVKFGSWRRKSEPGAEVNYFSSNEQSNDSKSSTLERFLSPERQPDFKISQYNTKTIPKKITKLKKARNKHRSAKFYTDLDISSACDEVLHISESNDSLEAAENQEIEDKVVAVSECTDNDAKDCNSNKDTDTENNTETIENIVSQLLMQNREFQKILKKQKKHINLRNRLNKTPTFESNKNKEIDNASDVEINIENTNSEEGENIYETLLNNADNGKFTDLTKEQNAKFDESDYVTLSYKSQQLILDNTHKDKNEILSLENMNRNNKIQERVLQNKFNDSKKSPIKLNLKDDPSLPNSEKTAKKLDVENTSVETHESHVNYENLNDVRKKIDLSSKDPENMLEGICPNTAEIWLKQQFEHMATPSTKKAGSLPRSFESNEYFPFEKCSKYLSRGGKPLNSDRPLTVASDNLADIDFTDIKNFFLEMSNEFCSETKGENIGEVEVEVENAKEEPIYDVPISKPVSDEKPELPSINIHPEYKIYRPSINLSAVKSVLTKANKKASKFDETNSIEDLTKERKQTATIVRHYSRSLLQRFKNIINEDIQNSSEFSESVNELNQTNEKNLSENQKEIGLNQIYDVPRKIVTDRSSDIKEEAIRYGCVSSSNPKINDPCYNLNTSILNSESAWPAIRVSPCKDLPTYKQGSESLGARIAQSDYANPRELFVNVKPENILINTYSLRPDSLLSNSSHFTSSSDEYQDEEHNKSKADRNSNSDCYYETTAERLLENDVFRDSAVYSDHDDGIANKDKALTEAINPTARIVRHESVSKLKSQRNHILVEKIQSRIVRNTQIHETVEQSSAEISDVKNGNSLQKTCSNPLNKRQIKRPTKLPPPIPVKPELKLCKTETVHFTKVETVNDIMTERNETENSNVRLARNEQTSLKKESIKVEINKSIVQRRKELEEVSNTSISSKVSVMKKPAGNMTSKNSDQKVIENEKFSVSKKDSRIPVGKYSIDKKRADFDEKCSKRQMFNSDINENKTESSSEATIAKEMLSSTHSKGWVKHVVEKFQ